MSVSPNSSSSIQHLARRNHHANGDRWPRPRPSKPRRTEAFRPRSWPWQHPQTHRRFDCRAVIENPGMDDVFFLFGCRKAWKNGRVLPGEGPFDSLASHDKACGRVAMVFLSGACCRHCTQHAQSIPTIWLSKHHCSVLSKTCFGSPE